MSPRPNFSAFNESLSWIGNAFAQRQAQERQQQQSIQNLIMQEKLKQIFAQQQFKQNLKNYQDYAGMFGGRQPSINQPQQRPQPSLQDIISQMPQEQKPVMSLPSGGVGNIQSRPVDLAAALSRMQGQPMAQEQQTDGQQENPFILSPNSIFSGKPEFVTNPDYERAYQKSRDKRLNMGNSTRIRQEFLNRPEVKDYVLVKTKASQLDALLKSALSGNQNNKIALQQGIITLFNKITDPQSVVRESEYARTPENAPVVNRIIGAWQKLQQGGAGITNDDLKAIVIGAKILANESGKIYQGTLDEYKTLASDLGIDENLITRGIQEHKDWDVSQGQVEELRFKGADNQPAKINRVGKYTFQ